MSFYSKLLLLVSGFSLIVMTVSRVILGGWYSPLYAFLVIFILGIVLSLVLDYKLYLEILSVKTARAGLSLGWSVLLLFLFLVGVAYLGNRFNKTFDLTEEGINSLSTQTTDVLDKLDDKLTFLVFYKGDKISEQVVEFKRQLKQNLLLYKQSGKKVDIEFVDTYTNHLKAEEYLSDLSDKNQQELFVFVHYKGRKIRVDIPFSEEDLTAAIIKAQKREFKEILFLTGHAEKDLENSEAGGLKILNQYLNNSGFVLKEWNFIQQGVPQNHAAVVMIVGPGSPFLPAEKAWLSEYLSKGGSLFISLDPKDNHQLTEWLKNYGLIFNNNFIVSQLGILYGGVTKALGVVFDKENPITKKLSEKQTAVFFEKASSIDFDTSLKGFQFSTLVGSHQQSFTADKLSDKIKVKSMQSLAMAVEAKYTSSDAKSSDNDSASSGDSDVTATADKEGDTPDDASSDEVSVKDKSGDGKKDFQIVLFGDSDFLTNRYIYEQSNRDLALNTLVALAGEEELITIRPKRLKGTKITLHASQRLILVLLYIVLPCVFLLISLGLWFKRRSS